MSSQVGVKRRHDDAETRHNASLRLLKRPSAIARSSSARFAPVRRTETRTLNASVTSDPGLSLIRSKGRVEQPEPAAQVLLDRQLVLELCFQLELLGVVALLVLA